MGTTFYAYAALPLALVTALSFSTPLFMIFLAWMFLGEKPGWTVAMATVGGFAGVVIMAGPDMGVLNPGWMAALASPLLVAIVLAIVKRMTVTEPTLTIVATYSFNAVLLSLPVAVSSMENPVVE